MSSSSKKQRLNNSIAKLSSTNESSSIGLPAELWAHVLQFATLNEVITCTAINTSFLNDVTKQIKVLHIKSGESMDINPEAIKRFSSVERVDVYVVRKIEHGITDFHLDVVAMQNAVTFLSNLPNLKWCNLTDDSTSSDRQREWIDHYDVSREELYDHPQSKAKWRDFIASVCKAYRTGKLSDQVEFDGLISYNGGVDGCAWKNIPKINSYRDDVCQICDMLCNSLPPLQLLESNDEFIPCISYSNMAKIIRFRDEEKCQSTMTAAIVNEIDNNWDCETDCLMCPPDYVTRECSAMQMYDYHFERLECLIANGGNPNDSTVINRLLDKQRYSSEHFLGRRRIVELETYSRLKSLGCEMKEDYFVSVDRNDKRTNVTLFNNRKIKSQLDSGIAFCDIEEVQDRIKRILNNGVGRVYVNHQLKQRSDLTARDVMELLTELFEFNSSDYIDNIESFMCSVCTAQQN